MTTSADSLRLEIAPKAGFLLTQQMRWKVLKGGRDAAKSHSVARAALALGMTRPTRFLCCRELFTSVEESIYRLLRDQIKTLHLERYYEVSATHIVGRDKASGTEFAFTGLRHNVLELKSYEGFDIAIVEEAANVSLISWDTLENTIRKPGSEIWVVYNPELETDATHQKLAINPPEDSIVVHMTWRDNPWPSEVLRIGREKMKRERPYDFENVWEGMTRNIIADAIYADEMGAAEREGRICRVPYDASAAVHTFWDLGYGNFTSIWCAQRVGVEWRVLRFFQDQNKFVPYYVAELQKLPYMWGVDYLPHDAAAANVRGDSVEKQLKNAGRTTEVLAREAVDVGINSVRALLPFCVFDRELCSDGLQCLRHYRWKKNNDGVVISREPLHDEYSDGADAFRTFAMARNLPAKRSSRRAVAKPATHIQRVTGSNAWMG
jgi:phage terminase large subunit